MCPIIPSDRPIDVVVAGDVTVGHEATVSLDCLELDAKPPVSSYTWSKNGMTLSSETSMTYTTVVSYPADDGATFTCTAGNTAGTTTSPDFVIYVAGELML